MLYSKNTLVATQLSDLRPQDMSTRGKRRRNRYSFFSGALSARD